MEISEAKILEKLSEISFKILGQYDELIMLETNPKSLDYDEKRKRIIEKLVALSLKEEQIYSMLNYDADAIARIIDFINENYLKNSNNNIKDLDYLYKIKNSDNNIVIFRILEFLNELYKKYKSKDDSDYYNEYISLLLDEGIDIFTAKYFYDTVNTKIELSFLVRKAANIKHEADNMKNKGLQNELIKSYFRQIFLNKYLEDTLLQTEYQSVPCRLDEELKFGIIPKSVQNTYINYTMLKRAKKVITVAKEETAFPIECIITFKTILLYLTTEGIEEVKELINKTSFKLFYLKQILLDEIKYLDLNKAYHNKDSQEKKEMS